MLTRYVYLSDAVDIIQGKIIHFEGSRIMKRNPTCLLSLKSSQLIDDWFYIHHTFCLGMCIAWGTPHLSSNSLWSSISLASLLSTKYEVCKFNDRLSLFLYLKLFDSFQIKKKTLNCDYIVINFTDKRRIDRNVIINNSNLRLSSFYP